MDSKPASRLRDIDTRANITLWLRRWNVSGAILVIERGGFFVRRRQIVELERGHVARRVAQVSPPRRRRQVGAGRVISRDPPQFRIDQLAVLPHPIRQRDIAAGAPIRFVLGAGNST
jgi:hypothetical protein